MSEDEPRKPEPFGDLSFTDVPSDLPPIPLEFPGDPKVAEILGMAPAPQPEKRKWWQSGKKQNKKTERPSKKPMPPLPQGGLKQPLMNVYMGLGMMLMPFNATVAKTVMESAEACADAWVEFAKTNPAVKRFLIQLCATSALGVVITAHVPILLAVFMATPMFQKSQGERMANMAELFANGHLGKNEEKDES